MDDRDFHGYTTKRGSTYNAYFILGEEDHPGGYGEGPFMGELLARVASVVDPARIDYIISNHTEMDHSGCLPQVIQQVRPEKVFASVMGAKALKEHFRTGIEVVPLKDGQDLSLGNMNLSFMETRMLHWPDSMFTYLKEDRLLFSQDAFGMHLATSERFADEIDQSILDYEAATYYANILLPYSPLVIKLLDRVEKSGIPISIIAPDHGPVWRTDPARILSHYQKWAEQRPTNKAVVLYNTMWHSTEMMARAIEEGLRTGLTQVKVMSMDVFHRSDAAYEILDAGALIAGSSTLNNQMLPSMADVLTYLKGLRPRNLIGAAFGSYGWSGEAPDHINGFLADMGVDLVRDPVKSNYVPDDDALKSCYELGRTVAQRLGEII